MLAKMDSPYIVKYFDCFVENGKLYIVTEYAPGGTLHEYITKQGGKGLPEAVVWRLLIHMTAALQHMHRQRVLHRDMCDSNCSCTFLRLPTKMTALLHCALPQMQEFCDSVLLSCYSRASCVCWNLCCTGKA